MKFFLFFREKFFAGCLIPRFLIINLSILIVQIKRDLPVDRSLRHESVQY